MDSKVRNNEIYETLRTRIYTGQLCGGSVLIESELAQEFSLSRTPIRQVLQRLALDKLIETRNGVGTLVVSEDVNALPNDLYCCQELLRSSVGLAVDKIDQETDFDLSGLLSVVTKLQRANDLEMLWTYYSKMAAVVSRQIDHDILSNAVNLLFGRIFRQASNHPEIDSSTLFSFAIDEYQVAKQAKSPKELIDARMGYFSAIEDHLKGSSTN